MIKTEIIIWLAHCPTLSDFLRNLSKNLTMSISISMIVLEVYFNWPLKSLKSDRKWVSNGIFMPTSQFTDVTEE